MFLEMGKVNWERYKTILMASINDTLNSVRKLTWLLSLRLHASFGGAPGSWSSCPKRSTVISKAEFWNFLQALFSMHASVTAQCCLLYAFFLLGNGLVGTQG